jgi:hypothetical protein
LHKSTWNKKGTYTLNQGKITFPEKG